MSLAPEVKSRVTDEALVQRRRAQIIAAAVELFSRQGYYRTTMLDVARKAGVSAGLIYQYVSDKDDVLLLALLDVLDAYRQEIPRALDGLTDPLERWRAALGAYLMVVDRQREATVLAYRSTKSLPRDRRQVIQQTELETNAILAGCVRDGVAAGVFHPVDVELATHLMVMFAHAWALKHWRLRDRFTFEAYVEGGVELFARTLLTPKGRRRYRTLVARRTPGRARKPTQVTVQEEHR